jgi:hypothetical protein
MIDAFSITSRIEWKFIDFVQFKEAISEISEKFHTVFNDFDSLKPKLQLFNNPMDTKVTQQPFDL